MTPIQPGITDLVIDGMNMGLMNINSLNQDIF